MFSKLKSIKVSKKAFVILVLILIIAVSLAHSHFNYSRRAAAARVLPEGCAAIPGRIYFVSFSENCLAVSILGWYPNVGHAALVTNDGMGTIRQYDYGWFVGSDGGCSDRGG